MDACADVTALSLPSREAAGFRTNACLLLGCVAGLKTHSWCYRGYILNSQHSALLGQSLECNDELVAQVYSLLGGGWNLYYRIDISYVFRSNMVIERGGRGVLAAKHRTFC